MSSPSSPASPSQITKVGIAIYHQIDERRNRPRGPHWALVLHPTSFSAPDVRVFHIRERSGVWSLGHEVCEISTLGALMGVLGVGEVRAVGPGADAASAENNSSLEKTNEATGLPHLQGYTFQTICEYLSHLPPTRSTLPDPSGLFVWTCEAYVIRALAFLEVEGALEMPCRPEEMYEYTKGIILKLRTEKQKMDADRDGRGTGAQR